MVSASDAPSVSDAGGSSLGSGGARQVFKLAQPEAAPSDIHRVCSASVASTAHDTSQQPSSSCPEQPQSEDEQALLSQHHSVRQVRAGPCADELIAALRKGAIGTGHRAVTLLSIVVTDQLA